MKTLSHLSVLSSSTHRFIKRERERARAPSECIGVGSALSARSLLSSQSLHATMNISFPQPGDYKNMHALAAQRTDALGGHSIGHPLKYSGHK